MKLLAKHHTPQYWKGGGFPLTTVGKAIRIQEEVKLVRSALLQLFNTEVGERVMYPAFGCELKRLLFDPNDQFIEQDITYYIRDAIVKWEPRVSFVSATLKDSALNRNNNIAEVVVAFRLRNNPSSTQVVDIPISIV